MKVLIAYATTEGQTAHIAETLREKIVALGLEAMAVDLGRKRPAIEDYDRVVVAGSIHVGKYQKEVSNFVSANVERLNAMPSWFIGVSMAEAGGDKPGGHDAAQALIDAFITEHGWRPTGTRSLAGALKYREYNFLKRMVMKRIVASQGGETDTSRDWEYTDWAAVDRLAKEIAGAAVPA